MGLETVDSMASRFLTVPRVDGSPEWFAYVYYSDSSEYKMVSMQGRG